MATATKTRTATNGKAAARDLRQSVPDVETELRAGDVLSARDALEVLAQQRIPFRSAMAIRRALRAVGGAAADVQAEREKIINEYALRNDDGEIVFDPKNGRIEFGENRQAYAAAHTELMDTVVTVATAPVPASLLEEIDEIEPAILLGLGDLLMDDL